MRADKALEVDLNQIQKGCLEFMCKETTENCVLNGALSLKQPREGYRFAIDPVFLAVAIKVKAGEVVLDAGCGVGTASLCLLYRCPQIEVHGVDIQADLIELALENASKNDFSQSFLPKNLSLTEVEGIKFDHIMSNPPYYSAGTQSPSLQKHLSHQETHLSLMEWIQACADLLKPKGSLTLIHTPERLPEILTALEMFGEITLFPLWPKVGAPAKRILIRARKGVKAPSALKNGLILHNEDGRYTREAEEILREGKELIF